MPAYIHHRRVVFHDTDAASLVYFANYFSMAEEAETHAMADLGFRLDTYVYPRVHAEADYHAPMRFWDECEIHAGLEKIGTTSLHWRFEFRCNGSLRATLRYISARRFLQDNAPAPYSQEERERLQTLILPPVLSEK